MDEIRRTYHAAAARLGMNICAATGTGEISAEEIDGYAARKWNIHETASEAGRQLSQNLGCRLYASYGNTDPYQIKSDEKIYDLARELWFMRYLSRLEAPCGYLALRNLYERKYQEERQRNPGVRPGYFYRLLNYYLYDDTQIAQIWSLLRKSQKDIQEGHDSVCRFFSERKSRFICEIYGAPEAGPMPEAPARVPAPQSPSAPVPPDAFAAAQPESSGGPEQKPVPVEKAEEAEENTPQSALPDELAAELAACREVIAQQDVQIQNYRTQIDYLEKARQKTQVDLDYARKDVIRELMECLTDGRFGAPLSELYLLGRNPELANAVRAVTLNLFAALESLKITVYGTNRIGQTIALTPEKQKKYSPAYGEEITLEDAVTIRYPGYRYGRDPLIRPVIEKVRKEHGTI